MYIKRLKGKEMNLEEFTIIFNNYLKELELELNEKQIENFYKYMKLLIEWNEKINLTAITKPEEVILKHFIDSLTISKYVENGAKVIDIGTGAGFPGIPLKIYRNDIKVTLLDSLNKRINFLDEVINKLNLKGIKAIHGRAEELGRNKDFREKYSVSTSRAVANLSTLSEYLLPFVKVGGNCICMKGSDIENELTNAKNAIKLLGGKIEDKIIFNLPKSDLGRSIILIKKVKNTPNKFPRKPGTPAKEPIL